MKTVILTAVIGLVIPLAFSANAQPADDGHVKAVRELFQAMDIEKTVSETLGSTAALLAAQTENPAKAKPLMEKFIHETIGFKAVESDMIKLYQATFTLAELQEITKFYKTPTGKKFAGKQSELFKEGAQIGQAKLLSRQEELQKIIEQVNKK